LTAPSDSLRIVAVVQHQRFGMQHVVADPFDGNGPRIR
jgi:hypothetical protein